MRKLVFAMTRSVDGYIEGPESGLPRISLRSLRHSHATMLLAAGENLKVIQDRLGHKTLGITVDIYAQVIPAQRDRAAARAAALIDGSA